jgi:hypothetical protein
MRLILCVALILALIAVQPTFGDSLLELERSLVGIVHTELEIKKIVGTGFVVAPCGLVVTVDHLITDDAGKPFSDIWAIHRVNLSTVAAHELILVKRFRDGLVGRDLAILKPKPPIDAPGLIVGGAVELGDFIVIGGFPLVFDRVYDSPLFRRGMIASTRFTFQKVPGLVLDLTPANGFSGSPVISEKAMRVIGIFIGSSLEHNATNFSVAIPLAEADVIGTPTCR